MAFSCYNLLDHNPSFSFCSISEKSTFGKIPPAARLSARKRERLT
jgi:hypothetical protein